jgi:hypothetical protein
MWTLDELSCELDGTSEWPTVIVQITTPIGTVHLIGEVVRWDETMKVDRAHVQGLWPGACQREGLNDIGRKLLEFLDVKELLIQGGARTTGRGKGRVPRAFKFPNG